MAPAVDQDHAPGDLTSETGSQPLAESGATASPNRILSRLDTQFSSANGSRDRRSDADDNGDEALRNALSATTSPSSIMSPPPYWPHAGSHQRTISSMSAESILPVGAIRLFDRDTNDDDRNSACWAKSVEITDYIIVNGSNTNIGAFVVWNVRVETLTVSSIRFLCTSALAQICCVCACAGCCRVDEALANRCLFRLYREAL